MSTVTVKLQKLTPKIPCLRASAFPFQLQKKMWDFPQVTMVFWSVGWNSTTRTTSLVVCKNTAFEHRWNTLEPIKTGAVTKTWAHLDLCYLWLLLPIPDCQHVVVTVINHTQVPTRILRDTARLMMHTAAGMWELQLPWCTWLILTTLEKAREPTPRSNVSSPMTWSLARLTLSQTWTWAWEGQHPCLNCFYLFI